MILEEKPQNSCLNWILIEIATILKSIFIKYVGSLFFYYDIIKPPEVSNVLGETKFLLHYIISLYLSVSLEVKVFLHVSIQ